MDRELDTIEKQFFEIVSTIAVTRKIRLTGEAGTHWLFQLENESVQAISTPLHVSFLSGISGVGKSSIGIQLEADNFQKVPNVTTRLKRSEERNHDYHFLTISEFQRFEQDNELFHPHQRNEVWHAIKKSDISLMLRSEGKLYMDKSISSIKELFCEYPNLKNTSVCFYILPPSIQELFCRISNREVSRGNLNHLSNVDIIQRFKEEIADFSLSSKMKCVYLVNDDLKRVVSIIKNSVECITISK